MWRYKYKFMLVSEGKAPRDLKFNYLRIISIWKVTWVRIMKKQLRKVEPIVN